MLKDVSAQTGTIPVRTGVYICADDPNASLQFAWTGGGKGHLIDCSTLNTLGVAALAAVGRSDLWLNGLAMLDFVKAHQDNTLLRSDSFFLDSQSEALASSLVARQAFTSKKCSWYYVELIHDEFEDFSDQLDNADREAPSLHRFEAGRICEVAGFYFTPAKVESRRHFNIGDEFPDEHTPFGATIWQFDERQG